MVTKNEGGQDEHSNSASVRHCGDRFFFNLNVQLTCKQFIYLSACYSFINRHCLDDRGSGVKMFLSVITAPIVLAQLIDFLIRRCHVNRIVILHIRSATPIQDINTSVPILLAL
jgi:hypothetical protein